MSQKFSSNAYFSEPEDVFNWPPINEGSSADALEYLKMGFSTKRKRSADPKGFSQTGRSRKQRADHCVDEMEQCAKRMKCMSLQNVQDKPMMTEVNPSEIDAGYEGDSEG